MSGISGSLAMTHWQKNTAAVLLLAAIGLSIGSQRITTGQGFITDDSTHLEYSYTNGLNFLPHLYLPGVPAHRPIGRDAITLLLRLYGENHVPILWSLLLVHIANSLLVWHILRRSGFGGPASFCGAAFFLLQASAHLAVYSPAIIFDLLSTFFLSCLLTFVIMSAHSSDRRRRSLLILAILTFIAAVKTKESSIAAIVPVCLAMVLSGYAPTMAAKDIASRIGQSLWRNGRWLVCVAFLVTVLAVTSKSDYFGVKHPDHPYYRDFSLSVVGQSFGYYLASLAFETEQPAPMQPAVAYAVLLSALAAAISLRQKGMILGWCWFVVFLLPLATLKNHYDLPYYPYPANIGTSLFLAGMVEEVTTRVSRPIIANCLKYALPVVFVLVVAQRSSSWLKADGVMRWYDEVHRNRDRVVRALKESVPQPPRYSKFVLSIPWIIHLDANISSLIRVIYHDFTLAGELVGSARETEESQVHHSSAPVYVGVWQDGGLRVRQVAGDVQ